MPALALFALANLKHDFAALVGWLSHRSFWQLVSIALAGLCILLWFQRNDARSDAARWQKQDAAHVAELKRITAARSAQKQTTDKNVAKVIERQRVVQKIVQVIHDAPNPPDCKTPALETLRNAL